MTANHSTTKPATSKATKLTPAAEVSGKPSRPEGCPLFAHATKRWAKKIRGKLEYFGSWADGLDAALANYNKDKEALHAGRKPKEEEEEATMKRLCDDFLNAKLDLQESGELSPRTFNDYKATTDLIIDHFGRGRLVADLDTDDFAALRNKLAKKWGPVTLGNAIQRIRVVFKFAYDSGLVPTPIRYGPGFKRPSKKTLRLEKAKHGTKLFTAEELRRVIDAAPVPLKAMILLGINCGFGNSDCGTLPLEAVDLDAATHSYGRPKTGIPRRCPLWPETVAAIREALDKRLTPKDKADAGLVFVTRYGFGWAKDIADSPITKETRKLLDDLGINGHRNFYTLRHTFRTIADATKDQPAVDFIMGHESPHMSSTYRHTFVAGLADDRLLAVVDHVHQWLFGK
jgi:integrase